ncbi:MAG TPA: MFS transporter [Pseudonocardiaceae bacterium]|jgi:MFS family permease|nr:MFS transporter [Pseudonocardiaceae bacterium]
MVEQSSVDGGQAGDSPGARLNRATLVAACLSVAVAQLCLTLPSSINGDIQAAFGASGSQLAWVTSAFILPTAILELNFGLLGDLFGRKRLLVFGALLLAVGNLVDVIAGSIQIMWLGQALAGIGAAALFPSSLAVVAAGTPEPAARAKALARWALSLSIASAIGPLLSGWLGTVASFRVVFVIPMVVGVIVAVVNQFAITDSRAPAGRRLDWPGQISVAVALFSLLWGILQGSSIGWSAPAVIVAFVIAVVFLVAFVFFELRSPSPMFKLSLLRIPAFAGAAGVALVGMLGFIGTAYSVSIRIGVVQHQSSLRTAFPFVLVQVIPLLLAPVLSRLLRQVNPRWLLIGGLLPLAVGQFWFASLPISATSLTPLIVPALLLGIGFILVVSSLTAAAVNAVPVELAGMASAGTSLVREFGQVLGPAVISAVLLDTAASAMGGQFQQAGLTAAQQAEAGGALKGGGPLAVVSANFGPDTEKIYNAGALALQHGLTTGIVVCGIASLVGAVISFVVIRPAKKAATAAPAQAMAE